MLFVCPYLSGAIRDKIILLDKNKSCAKYHFTIRGREFGPKGISPN